MGGVAAGAAVRRPPPDAAAPGADALPGHRAAAGGHAERIGQGFEVLVAQVWPPRQADNLVIWHERMLVVRSDKLAHRQQQGLADRLRRAEQALTKLKAAPKAELA